MLLETASNMVDVQANALRAAYYDDGAFIVRQLLPMTLIESVAKHIISLVDLVDATVAQACPVNLNTDAVKAASWMLQEVERREPGSQAVIYDAMNHTPLMHKIAASDETPALLETLNLNKYSLHRFSYATSMSYLVIE